MPAVTCPVCGAPAADPYNWGGDRCCERCAQARRDALGQQYPVGGQSSPDEEQIVTPAKQDLGRHWLPIGERGDARRRRYKHE